MVSIVTNLRVEKSGVRIPAEARDLFSETSSPTLESNQPHILWVTGSIPWLERGHDVEHSLPTSTEVTSKWGYTSALPVHLHGMDRKNFTIFFAVNCVQCLIPKDFGVQKNLYDCQPGTKPMTSKLLQ